MMNKKRLAAMIMALTMTSTAVCSIGAFAAEDETETEPVTVGVIDAGSTGFVHDETHTDEASAYTGTVTPTLKGAFSKEALEAAAFVEVTISWEDMKFEYDYGTYDIIVENQNNPDQATKVQVKKVDGAGWGSTKKYPINIEGVTTVPIDVTLKVNKSDNACYSNVEVYLDEYTGGNNKNKQQTFGFEPEVQGNYVNLINKTTYLFISGAPDYRNMDRKNPPTLFTYEFDVSLHKDAPTQ